MKPRCLQLMASIACLQVWLVLNILVASKPRRLWASDVGLGSTAFDSVLIIGLRYSCNRPVGPLNMLSVSASRVRVWVAIRWVCI